MAVLAKKGERKPTRTPWLAAKREADKKILDENIAEIKRKKAEASAPMFNPMDIHWSSPPKRTRKPAA